MHPAIPWQRGEIIQATGLGLERNNSIHGPPRSRTHSLDTCLGLLMNQDSMRLCHDNSNNNDNNNMKQVIEISSLNSREMESKVTRIELYCFLRSTSICSMR